MELNSLITLINEAEQKIENLIRSTDFDYININICIKLKTIEIKTAKVDITVKFEGTTQIIFCKEEVPTSFINIYIPLIRDIWVDFTENLRGSK